MHEGTDSDFEELLGIADLRGVSEASWDEGKIEDDKRGQFYAEPIPIPPIYRRKQQPTVAPPAIPCTEGTALGLLEACVALNDGQLAVALSHFAFDNLDSNQAEYLETTPGRVETSELAAALDFDGFSVVPSVAGSPACRAAMHTAVLATTCRGLPACFALMSPHAWRLLKLLYESVAVPLLGDDAELERSVFCLHVEPAGAAATPAVASAFSLPHRDYPTDTDPESGRLAVFSCWVPLTPHGAPLDGGCMHFVPWSEHEWEHPPPPATRPPGVHGDHPVTAVTFDLGEAVATPVPAGGAAVWAGTTVHWGGTPMRGRPARVTLACSFRNCAVKDVDEQLPVGTVGVGGQPGPTGAVEQPEPVGELASCEKLTPTLARDEWSSGVEGPQHVDTGMAAAAVSACGAHLRRVVRRLLG